MKVIRFESGKVLVEMTEEEAKKLHFVTEDVTYVYLEVAEDEDEDAETRGFDGLVANTLLALKDALEAVDLAE